MLLSKRKNFTAALAAAAIVLLVLAIGPAAADQTPKDPQPAAAPAPLDPTHFCYIAGVPYSEGYVINGQKCESPSGAWNGGGAVRALVWVPVVRGDAFGGK